MNEKKGQKDAELIVAMATDFMMDKLPLNVFARNILLMGKKMSGEFTCSCGNPSGMRQGRNGDDSRYCMDCHLELN